MDCGQTLSLPKDIAWQRLAFSKDMFDIDFRNPSLPRKWRSSLAAFYYMVPEEETEELYPDRRIMYLKVNASIAGINTLDEFKSEVDPKLVGHDIVSPLNRLHKSTLVEMAGEVDLYHPCKGAILQVSVYPHSSDLKARRELWDYPFIQDFEPKKRELFETVSESGEVLSGSSTGLNLKKGLTTSDSTEQTDIKTVSGAAGVSVGPFGVQGSYKNEWSTKENSGSEESNLRTTDSTRDKRETQSRTTNINQMYQPLLSYHLGTNRALWVMTPRPHTVDSFNNLLLQSQYRITEEGDLIVVDGRQLEGIQDVFLVVNMPKTNSEGGAYKGICFQATLDTGHTVQTPYIHYEPNWEPELFSYSLLVMRRTIQNCATFDKNGNLEIRPKHQPRESLKYSPIDDIVVHESKIQITSPVIKVSELNDPSKKRECINKANLRSIQLNRTLIDGNSSPVSKAKHFTETDTFKTMALSTLMKSNYSISRLEDILTKRDRELLKSEGIRTVKDLMTYGMPGTEDRPPGSRLSGALTRSRKRLIESTSNMGSVIADHYRAVDKTRRETLKKGAAKKAAKKKTSRNKSKRA